MKIEELKENKADFKFDNVRNVRNIDFQLPNVYSNDSYNFDFKNVRDVKIPQVAVQGIEQYNMPNVNIFGSKPFVQKPKPVRPVPVFDNNALFSDYNSRSYTFVGDQLE